MLAVDYTWTRLELGDGLAALARASGIPYATVGANANASIEDRDEITTFFRQQAQALNVRLEPTHASYDMLSTMLRQAAPAVIRLEVDGAECFVLLLGSRGGHLRVIGRDLGVHRISGGMLTEAIAAPVIADIPTDVDGCIRDAGIAASRRPRARQAMLSACLRGVNVGSIWLLRTASREAIGQALHRDGIRGRAAFFIVTHLGQLLVGLLLWTLIGRLAFGTDRSTVWLWPIGLALLTLVPLQLCNTWLAGTISLDFGVRLKQRLFSGALSLPFEQIRGSGIGSHLGRVFESDGFEALLLSSGTTGLMAMIQLLAAVAIFALGAGSILNACLLIAWISFACGAFFGYARQRRQWAEQRLSLTNGTVERLVGHQTRLAQEFTRRLALC